MAYVALLILLSSTISFLACAHATVQVATFSVDPATTTVPVSAVFTVNIIITDVANLNGWGFNIIFDPVAVECVDVTEGPFLQSGGPTVFVGPVIDNTVGFVKAIAVLYASAHVSGSGTLAYVTFHCKGPTDTHLHFDETDTGLNDPALEIIPSARVDGYVQQLPSPVIPEVPLGTIMASAAMIIALAAYVAVPKRRRKQAYVNP